MKRVCGRLQDACVKVAHMREGMWEAVRCLGEGVADERGCVRGCKMPGGG